uniref:Uncharacterized protein n=1 Tax=Arundo donax TaxID=35708 RepID=A0A0A9GXH5_ARUDO
MAKQQNYSLYQIYRQLNITIYRTQNHFDQLILYLAKQ